MKNCSHWQELQEADFDLDLTGFDGKEIDDLLALDDVEQANATPPLLETAVSRAGDLWLLGDHRVLYRQHAGRLCWTLPRPPPRAYGLRRACLLTPPNPSRSKILKRTYLSWSALRRSNGRSHEFSKSYAPVRKARKSPRC